MATLHQRWHAWRPPCPTTSTMARSCHPRGQRRRCGFVIAEGERAVADDLPGLVALAGDQQRIARLQVRDRYSDRLGAIADLARTRSSAQDRGTDRGRILAARIVVGDDDVVRIGNRDLAHQWAFSG